MSKEPIEEPIEDKALEEMLKDFFNAGYDYRSSLMPESIEGFGENCQPNFKTYYSEYEFIAGYKANKSDAVEFGKFLLANYETLDSDDMYWQLIGTNQIYTTEELYKEFKNKP